jgi:hypothetical protein
MMMTRTERLQEILNEAEVLTKSGAIMPSYDRFYSQVEGVLDTLDTERRERALVQWNDLSRTVVRNKREDVRRRAVYNERRNFATRIAEELRFEGATSVLVVPTPASHGPTIVFNANNSASSTATALATAHSSAVHEALTNVIDLFVETLRLHPFADEVASAEATDLAIAIRAVAPTVQQPTERRFVTSGLNRLRELSGEFIKGMANGAGKSAWVSAAGALAAFLAR